MLVNSVSLNSIGPIGNGVRQSLELVAYEEIISSYSKFSECLLEMNHCMPKKRFVCGRGWGNRDEYDGPGTF